MTPEALLQAANDVRKNSYCPYSQYPVGAALLTQSGKVYLGCNVENVSYGLTICAERTALASAIAAGADQFVALAVVTKDGGSLCGACRQVMAEFGGDITVYMGSPDGAFRTTTVGELLPDGFAPDSLDG